MFIKNKELIQEIMAEIREYQNYIVFRLIWLRE